MRVLLVCRFKPSYPDHVAPFIKEQAAALEQLGVTPDWYLIKGSYVRNFLPFFQKIKELKPDLIHAHYGLSGLFATMQRKIPVVTTFHGSDIHQPGTLWLSKLAARLSSRSVFVSTDLLQKAGNPQNAVVIPCGVDTRIFKPMLKELARRQLQLPADKRFVLFAGSFDNPVKNPRLAIEATTGIPNLRLLELKGYTRAEVALLMNAVDACLLTSNSEGSPQFIKEAMACNCPLVSVRVGDVEERMKEVAGCYLVAHESAELKSTIESIVHQKSRSAGRYKLLEDQLDNISVASRLLEIYNALSAK